MSTCLCSSLPQRSAQYKSLTLVLLCKTDKPQFITSDIRFKVSHLWFLFVHSLINRGQFESGAIRLPYSTALCLDKHSPIPQYRWRASLYKKWLQGLLCHWHCYKTLGGSMLAGRQCCPLLWPASFSPQVGGVWSTCTGDWAAFKVCLRVIAEKCKSPPYSEHSSASKISNLQLKEKLWMDEKIVQNGSLNRRLPFAIKRTILIGWTSGHFKGASFASFLSTLKLEMPQRRLRDRPWMQIGQNTIMETPRSRLGDVTWMQPRSLVLWSPQWAVY